MFETQTFQEAPLFDADHLARYTGGDEELRDELLTLMRIQAETCLEAMAQATDSESWRAATHTLKGSARGVGAFALGEVCEAAEEAVPSAWPAVVHHIRETVLKTEASLPGRKSQAA